MSTTATPGKQRSPNYPSISLGEAITRLKAIYEKQRRYPAPREVLAKLIGYGSLNGASASILSALGKYGLLEGHGDNLRVSEIGQDLALHHRGDPEFSAALRTAAFMPAFFRELRDQYPHGLPSEHSLRVSLTKRGFSQKAIDGAIRAYRDTIEFVDAVTGEADAAFPEETPLEVPMQTRTPSGQGQGGMVSGTITAMPGYPPLPTNAPNLRSIQLPYSHTEWATLQAAFPLDEPSWNQMMAVLNAMKPVLVAPPSPSPAAPASAQSPQTESEDEPGPEA